MRALTPRDLVIELLKTLDLAMTSWDSGSSGDGVRVMPSLYHEGSYAELQRRLREMRDSRDWHTPWWHVVERYLREPDSVVVSFRRTVKGPKPNMPPRTELVFVEEILDSKWMRVRCYRWTSAVEPRFVEAGVNRLTATMYGGDTQRIHLPKDLLDLALGKEPSDAKSLRESRVSPETLAAA